MFIQEFVDHASPQFPFLYNVAFLLSFLGLIPPSIYAVSLGRLCAVFHCFSCCDIKYRLDPWVLKEYKSVSVVICKREYLKSYQISIEAIKHKYVDMYMSYFCVRAYMCVRMWNCIQVYNDGEKLKKTCVWQSVSIWTKVIKAEELEIFFNWFQFNIPKNIF